jgi:hypothetical protein
MVLRKVLRWSGTGWYCPLNEEHKGMYWIPSKQGDRIGGYYYCASQEHSFAGIIVARIVLALVLVGIAAYAVANQ